MEQGGKIYSAMCAIMADINPIDKGRKNAQQGFNYRGIDEVMNELQPLLARHRVVIIPEVLEQTREERQTKNGSNLIYSVCRIRYTFYAEDGSSVAAVVVGEGMDSGDKATNKAMAVAMKYACLQALCIPTEEAKDPDGESHETAPRSKPAQAAAKPSAPDPVADAAACTDAIGKAEAIALQNGYAASLVDDYFAKAGTSRILATRGDCEKMLAVFRTIKPKTHPEAERGAV